MAKDESFIYAIRDVVAEDFGPPFTAVNDGVAQRSYRQFIAKHGVSTVEFQLHCLGTFDGCTGVVEGLNIPRLILVNEEK